MVVEQWTEGEETFHVVRFGYKSTIEEITDSLKELPPSSVLWETLKYSGETVEIVFRAAAQAVSAVA